MEPGWKLHVLVSVLASPILHIILHSSSLPFSEEVGMDLVGITNTLESKEAPGGRILGPKWLSAGQ